ncbi:hypothetical protein A5906_19175 [Bradyrhizobium sacchari]|uniref:Uncharacterized protein n=1 Tax=Bradyrhizobium sacchari TaxID=1399419 RepID=A0A560KGH9_9BRAD|nr:hypothetical protein [Bradyrhizobium sacchari]OPZ00335.1 hypothetical protein A5906_19175 [Bradyrhizobium sacchari]TWB64740.1 hypothetical protein FBZ94_102281 [Bradyrhizobium sacchari]TWB81064.1 hypothetical protein FBZ95_102282 [Bradyrhizobium sacchari]
MAKVIATSANPNLATQLATIREAATSPNCAALALVAAIIENPRRMALPKTAPAAKCVRRFFANNASGRQW